MPFSPADVGIDGAAYFERCFDGDKVRRGEVYFGWNL